jgi:uncharacterized protein (DUF488 family)
MAPRVSRAPDGMSRVLTFGHSTRSWAAGRAMLAAAGVRTLVDVRSIPRSRRHPHWSREELAPALAEEGVAYVWMRDLGGLRRPRPDSPNGGWRNPSFRGYADHMRTPAFAAALAALMTLAAGPGAPVCLMCAEAVPWRCHRSLIADALTVRGVEVLHIMDRGLRPHRLTPFAVQEGERLLYPPT